MSVSTYSLTTRQRLQDFMGFTTPTATQASVLDRVIDAVTDFVERYCGRRFQQTAYTQEVYDGSNSGTLMLKQYPVISTETTALEERTSAANEDSWATINSKDYFVHYNEGYLEFTGKMIFRKYPRAFRVTYTAGYDFDTAGTDTPESVGLGDLEYAVWKLATTAYNTRRGSGNVSSERLGDYSVTFRKQIMESDELKSILDKHAKIDYTL